MLETAKSMIQIRLGKVVWTIAVISITLARLPFWLVYYTPRTLRQHPKWTYLQAIKHRLMRVFLYHSSLMEVRTPIKLEPGIEKDSFVKIEPARKNIYQGVLAESDIRPATTGGWWFPSPYIANIDDETRVVLYFHGGAFVLGEGRAYTRFPATTLAMNLKAKVFSLSYRLSSNPTCQFPARPPRRSDCLSASCRSQNRCQKHHYCWRFCRRQPRHRPFTVYRGQQGYPPAPTGGSDLQSLVGPCFCL